MVSTRHNMTAKRYVEFCQTMNLLLPLSKVLLGKRLEISIITEYHSSQSCIRSALRDKEGPRGNPRIGIPNQLVKIIHSQNQLQGWRPVDRAKVPASWVAAWLANIHPDKSAQNWEFHQLSHICRKGDCITPAHLQFESAKINQQRGYRLCLIKCNHCDNILCNCQGIHSPTCLPSSQLFH